MGGLAAARRDGPDQVTDLDGFINALIALRARAGGPSFRTLARQVGPLLRPPREIAFRTVADIFKLGRRRLDLDLVLATVRALGADERQVGAWRRAYLRVNAEAKAGGPAGVLHQLPADLPTFTGREGQMRRLLAAATGSEALEHPDTAGARAPVGGADTDAAEQSTTVLISAIEGMAGVGKTQLAIHVAHELVRSGRYQDVQLYANLRGFDPDQPPADPSAVLDAFLRQLEVPAQHIPPSLDERAAMFRDRLHGRSTLILLDNAADENQVRDLIPGVAPCLVLLTSRRTLGGLDGAVLHQLDVFDESEAVALLGRIAGAERVAAEPEAAAAIAEVCGYLPLTVTLAAARLRTRPAWTLQDLVRRLRGEDNGLDAIRISTTRSLATVFDLSYRTLPEPTRRIYRLLGAFFPGEDFAAAASAALVDRPSAEVERALESLVDASLLKSLEAGRYRFHDLLRAFARRRAEQEETPEDSAAARLRLAGWYLYASYEARLAHDRTGARWPDPPPRTHCDPPVAFASSAEAVAWLDAERANLLAVTRLCSAHDFSPLSWLLPRSIIAHLVFRGAWGDLEKAVRSGLDAARAHDDRSTQGHLLLALADQRNFIGRHEEAARLSTEAAELHEQFADTSSQAHALVVLSDALSRAGRTEEATRGYQEAVGLYRTLGESRELSMTLNNFAYALFEAGQHEEAVTVATEAVELARSMNARGTEACALDSLGQAYRGLGRIAQASRTLRNAVECYRAEDDRYLGADALEHYADVLWIQGRRQAAVAAWREAAEWFEPVAAHRAELLYQKISEPGPAPGLGPALEPGRAAGPAAG